VVGSLRGAAQRGGVLDAVADHLGTGPVHHHSGVGEVHPAEALGAIQVVDGGAGRLAEGGQKGGQESVADGVVQATEAADEGFDALDQAGAGLKLPGERRAERLVAEPLIGGEEVAALLADRARGEGEPRAGVRGSVTAAAPP